MANFDTLEWEKVFGTGGFLEVQKFKILSLKCATAKFEKVKF